MPQKIILNNKKIEYTLKKSVRAKRLSVTVRRDASVFVTAPVFVNFLKSRVESFLREKADWILRQILYFKKLGLNNFYCGKEREFNKHKIQAYNFIYQKIRKINKIYNFKYNKICVRNQRTRWGSCSKRGNLNFNYRIVFLPEKLAEYVIIHELCHLGELNHSQKFWNLVKKAMPDYKIIIKELKKKIIV